MTRSSCCRQGAALFSSLPCSWRRCEPCGESGRRGITSSEAIVLLGSFLRRTWKKMAQSVSSPFLLRPSRWRLKNEQRRDRILSKRLNVRIFFSIDNWDCREPRTQFSSCTNHWNGCKKKKKKALWCYLEASTNTRVEVKQGARTCQFRKVRLFFLPCLFYLYLYVHFSTFESVKESFSFQ